jgi:hypothetical protein
VNLRRRVPWSARELATLRAKYPDLTAAAVAKLLRRPVCAIYNMAFKLGLEKSATFKKSARSGRLGKLNALGAPFRFKPGQVPHNKGLRRPGWAPGRMRETQFKKGRAPSEARNYQPIGTLRICADGILERKVTDDQRVVPARRWVAVQRLVWIEANGPIPAGHSVVFKPGRRTTIPELIIPDALELVTRAELMRRNSYHNRYPKEIGLVIQLRGAVNRKINRLAKESGHQKQA